MIQNYYYIYPDGKIIVKCHDHADHMSYKKMFDNFHNFHTFTANYLDDIVKLNAMIEKNESNMSYYCDQKLRACKLDFLYKYKEDHHTFKSLELEPKYPELILELDNIII